MTDEESTDIERKVVSAFGKLLPLVNRDEQLELDEAALTFLMNTSTTDQERQQYACAVEKVRELRKQLRIQQEEELAKI